VSPASLGLLCFTLLADGRHFPNAHQFITDKTGLEEIEGMNGHKVPLRMSIETVSFAQHVDGTQNTEFLEQIAADHVVRAYLPSSLGVSECRPILGPTADNDACLQVLVHGERHQMANLRNQLEKNAKHHGRDVKVHSPRNTEQLDIVLRTEHMAQVSPPLAWQPQSLP
jgi:cleavage and polyadenylation specificity factor subunit 3